jgi:UDP-N-acetylmuramate dehydrogenase
VLEAEFRLTRADPHELAERMERTARTRKSKTPWGSSCGSVFKNPPGDSAGRLVEAAGLKGARAGAAEIAHMHANYIVNLGGATSDDVLRLIELARETVLRQFGVELELEVQIV